MRNAVLIPALACSAFGAAAWLAPAGLGGSLAYAETWGGARQQMFLSMSEAPAGGGQWRRERSDSRLPVRDQETIRQTFDLGPGAHSIDLDNVDGSIEVVGTDSNQVSLVIHKTLRAENDRLLEAARKEVTLEVKHAGGSLQLFVNGPFRCNCGENGVRSSNCQGPEGRRSVNFQRDPGYSVQMDFQLQVPRQSDVRLSTVNSGEVTVRDIHGAYRVRNVNGGIAMSGIAGSGSAHTVNGPVKVAFRENPREASSFKSINGDIDLYFTRNLSADFRFKNFNGEVYSDFMVTSLPLRSIQEERDGRRHIFRADRYTGGRVGTGGVEIETENLNGDIRIRESQ